MKKRIEYLESLLPNMEVVEKHRRDFNKTGLYMGGGYYMWMGFYSRDTYELLLMGVLFREGIEIKDN